MQQDRHKLYKSTSTTSPIDTRSSNNNLILHQLRYLTVQETLNNIQETHHAKLLVYLHRQSLEVGGLTYIKHDIHQPKYSRQDKATNDQIRTYWSEYIYIC